MLLTWRYCKEPSAAETRAWPEKDGRYVKYHSYLAISLNDQLHITPKTAAINQSEFAFVALSYLRSLIPLCGMCVLCFNLMAAAAKKRKKKATVFQEFWRSCLGRSSHRSRTGVLLMMKCSLVIRVCLYYTHSQARRSNKSLKGTVKQRIKYVSIGDTLHNIWLEAIHARSQKY